MTCVGICEKANEIQVKNKKKEKLARIITRNENANLQGIMERWFNCKLVSPLLLCHFVSFQFFPAAQAEVLFFLIDVLNIGAGSHYT
jgi:hypothetical protein